MKTYKRQITNVKNELQRQQQDNPTPKITPDREARVRFVQGIVKRAKVNA